MRFILCLLGVSLLASAGCGDDDATGNNSTANNNNDTPVCSAGEVRCGVTGNVETCESDGSGWSQTEVCTDGCDSGTCNLVDPCATDNGGCDQICTFDSPGVATCSCDPGFVLDADGLSCLVDMCSAECIPTEMCNDGAIALDNNCDGTVDEGCPCTPGEAQACFKGDPAYVHEPGCYPGTQVCTAQSYWGPCQGGLHATDACQVNDVTGCHALSGLPFVPQNLKDGTGNFSADAITESFTVTCPPGVSPCPAVQGSNPPDDFTPLQSGEYTVTYHKTTSNGTDSCDYPLFVGATGLRVELDWEHDLGGTGVDLDLHVHKPGDTTPWQANGGNAVDCAWDNCTANDFISFPTVNTPDWFNGIAPPDPVDWYLDPIFEKNTCYFSPRGAGAEWQAGGQGCHSPRLDLDNITCDPMVTDPNNVSFCTPENINIDYPPLDQWTRIAVHYYSAHGESYNVHPRVSIYCDGRLAARLGPSGYHNPEAPVTFTPADGAGGNSISFWLVADVRFGSDGCGGRICTVQPLVTDAVTRTPVVTSVDLAQQSFSPPYPAP